ncbi:tripartite motif-containing protein 16-like protein [Engraulis encrasicolus]|uniref:tripartite motif-containing protein 16-like protein n=1 Tax=Engraulis encrasicolus TaxID=184585 RepID=UPI002FD6F600
MVFIQNMGSMSITDEPSATETRWTFNQRSFFEPLKESVSALKMQLEKKLHSIFEKEMDNIHTAANKAQILKSFDGQALPEPVTREDFLRYSRLFTLDPNTAHTKLHLSEENRRVEKRDEDQSYPDHPNRFDLYPQVLCREGVSARCY